LDRHSHDHCIPAQALRRRRSHLDADSRLDLRDTRRPLHIADPPRRRSAPACRDYRCRCTLAHPCQVSPDDNAIGRRTVLGRRSLGPECRLLTPHLRHPHAVCWHPSSAQACCTPRPWSPTTWPRTGSSLAPCASLVSSSESYLRVLVERIRPRSAAS